jgi:hypothetical protein
MRLGLRPPLLRVPGDRGVVADGAAAAAPDRVAVVVDGWGRGGKAVPVVGPCWCWASGVGMTEGHFVEAAGRVPAGIVGRVVRQPPDGCPLLGRGEGGALQQGGLQASLSPHVVNTMSVG